MVPTQIRRADGKIVIEVDPSTRLRDDLAQVRHRAWRSVTALGGAMIILGLLWIVAGWIVAFWAALATAFGAYAGLGAGLVAGNEMRRGVVLREVSPGILRLALRESESPTASQDEFDERVRAELVREGSGGSP